MKLGLLQEIDWAHVGSILANSDHEDQSVFFKAFVKECKTWGTNFQISQQLESVRLKLTSEEREVLSQITYDGES